METQTNPTEFKKFSKLVASLSPHYIPVIKNGKAPDPTISSWKTTRLSESEASERLRVGLGNVGIVAEAPKFLIVDLDCKYERGEGYPNEREKILENLLSMFPETLTVRTPSGGYHLYYLNDPKNPIPNFDFVDSYDPEAQKAVHLGEVRANARYVLVPGSYVKHSKLVDGEERILLEGGYTIVKEKPLARLTLSDIPKKLLPARLCSPSAQGETEAGRKPLPASPGKSMAKFFNRLGWSLEDIAFRQPKLAELLTQECPRGYDSPSEADEATATILYFWEFEEETYEQIMWAFRDREDPQRPGRRRFERSKDYLKRTWERARQFVGDKTITKLLQDNEIDPSSWSPKFETLPIPVVELEKVGMEVRVSDPIDDKFVADWINKLPSGHFLKEYFDMIRKRSDTYPEYILTSGLFAISTALDGKVIIPLSISRLKTNVYALLLGVSSYSRKTTTLNYLNQVFDRSTLGFSRGSDDMSPEGFVSELADNSHTFYIVDEFGGMLSTMKKTWGSGLLDMFMKLYDGQNHKRKLRSKTYTITQPYVCVISSTTPTRLYSESDESMVLSGFYPRFLIVSPQRKKDYKPVSLDYSFEQDVSKIGSYLDSINAWVTKISELYGQPVYATFTDEGMDFVNKMIMEFEQRIEGLQDLDREIEAMLWSRYQQYVLKIAVLLKFGEERYLTKPDLTSSESQNIFGARPHVEVSIDYLKMAKELVERMYYPYAKRVIYDILLAIEKSSFNKVVRLLKKYKVIKRSDLMRRSHVTAREFKEIIETLVMRNDIAVDQDNSDTYIWIGGD